MIKTKIKKQKAACGSSDNKYLHSLSGKNGQKKKSGNGKLDDNKKTTTTTKLSSSHRQHIFPVLQKQKQKLNCPFRSVAVADNTVACVFHFFLHTIGKRCLYFLPFKLIFIKFKTSSFGFIAALVFSFQY